MHAECQCSDFAPDNAADSDDTIPTVSLLQRTYDSLVYRSRITATRGKHANLGAEEWVRKHWMPDDSVAKCDEFYVVDH